MPQAEKPRVSPSRWHSEKISPLPHILLAGPAFSGEFVAPPPTPNNPMNHKFLVAPPCLNQAFQSGLLAAASPPVKSPAEPSSNALDRDRSLQRIRDFVLRQLRYANEESCFWFSKSKITARYLTMFYVAFALLNGCNRKSDSLRTDSEHQDPTATSDLKFSQRTVDNAPLSFGSLAQMPLRYKTVEQYRVANDRLIEDLISLSEQENATRMDLAARLILSHESEEDQEMMFNLVVSAFRDLAPQIALANELPAGRLRSLIISGWAIRFEQLDRNLEGLQTLYDSIPVGASRTDVGMAGARHTMAVSGLAAALDFTAALEMPEERYAAYLEVYTNKNLEPYAGDKEIEAKSNSIIGSFDAQHRAFYSRSRKLSK